MTSTRETAPRELRGYFEWFVHSEVTGSILLLACAVAALVWANSPWAHVYDDLLHTSIGVSWGDAAFKLSLHHWINDGLMVVFFFVIGLEIKRELVVGELSSMHRAVLPVAAAGGGMVVPAVVYAAFNAGGGGAAGWGIPMATDIAFALGVLAVFGTRAPLGLKVFLTALAIADDLGAVMVIAVFYTEKIRWGALLLATILLVALYGAIQARINRLGILLALIVSVWVAVFASGVHATVAGILVAMVIPVRPRVDLQRFIVETESFLDTIKSRDLSPDAVISNRDQLDAVEVVHTRAGETLPPGLSLEHYFHPVQVWLILPLFALANAGVRIDGRILEALVNPISLGIMAGLVVGKPLGITALGWLVVRFGRGSLPKGVNWTQVFGAGCLAGIGFTMSLFIADLAWDNAALIANAKVGILAASLMSAILGIVLLSRSLPPAPGK
jgi:NhaA family Na+:H+ antiporter